MIPHGSLESFFNTLSQVPKITNCPDCGSIIEPVHATLFCAETGEAQDITLPYCSNCDVTKPTSTVREPETATEIVLTRHRINALMRRIRRLIEGARRKIARRAAA